ncbi:MAG: site-2 protease family protein, partial [Gemmataceae bacterium]|nr:site-2 protease family protein [Gemmataceae bacterium]
YDPFRVSDLPPDPRQPETGQRDPFEFRRRLSELAGRPVVVQVRRHGAAEGAAPVGVFVPPAFHKVLGVRMDMGRVAAVRKDSPAAKAGVRPYDVNDNQPGDVISAVRLVGPGGRVLFAAGDDALGKELHKTFPLLNLLVRPLDPVRLPSQLARAAAGEPGRKTVVLTVPRTNANRKVAGEELPAMQWDDSWDLVGEDPFYAAAPTSVPQLGLAYWVTSRIVDVADGSPAKRARRAVEAGPNGQMVREADPLRRDDAIFRYRIRETPPGKPPRWGSWQNLKAKRGKDEVYESWAMAFRTLQLVGLPEVQLGIRRDGAEIEEPFEVVLAEDRTWPVGGSDRGLRLMQDVHLHRAETMGEALWYGVDETRTFIQKLYLGLSRLVSGRISTETLGGPIEIVSTTFGLASHDVYGLILFLGILSINLAVINFLPIPLLDGGHMVFLIYEKLRGKPASERVRVIATYIGLAFLLTLMVYVFYLDIKRRIIGG